MDAGKSKISDPVVFIGPTYPFKGGIAKYATLFYRHLRERHPAEMHTYRSLYPAWLFPGKSRPDPSREALRAEGAVRDLSFLAPWSFCVLGRRLRRRPVRHVIVTWWTSAWLPHVWLLLDGLDGRVPVTFWCHNVYDHFRSGVLGALAPRLLRRVRRFVVHTEAERAKLAGLAPGREIRVAPLPLFGVFHPSGAPVPAARSAGGPKRLLFFGFVRPYKGLEDLLTAMPEIRKQEPAQLEIVGEFWGRMRERTDRLVSELGLTAHVRIRDSYVSNEELAAVFQEADLVVLPYREATGSGVVNLAVEFERPVVVTDVGALPEAVLPGRTGWVARPGDPSDLARVVVQALRVPASAEALRAHRTDLAGGWDRLLDAVDEAMRGGEMR